MKEESGSVVIYEIPPEILAQARFKEKHLPDGKIACQKSSDEVNNISIVNKESCASLIRIYSLDPKKQ